MKALKNAKFPAKETKIETNLKYLPPSSTDEFFQKFGFPSERNTGDRIPFSEKLTPTFMTESRTVKADFHDLQVGFGNYYRMYSNPLTSPLKFLGPLSNGFLPCLLNKSWVAK